MRHFILALICFCSANCFAQNNSPELSSVTTSINKVLARYNYDFLTPFKIQNFLIKYKVSKDSLIGISISDGLDSLLAVAIIPELKKQFESKLAAYVKKLNRERMVFLIPGRLSYYLEKCATLTLTDNELHKSTRFKGKLFEGECILLDMVGYSYSSIR